MRLNLAAIAIIISLSAPALADATGSAHVVDGDTIRIGETKIRLHGIDAPEMKQTCRTKQGKEQRCGVQSKQALHAMVQGQQVRCQGDELDRYKRLIAVCFVGSLDINKQMVSDGWALAYRKYSKVYVKAERTAKANMGGIWQTEFIPPWEWRRGQRLVTSNEQKPATNKDASGTCLIKGNISSSGKIYHTPESRWYAKTKINISKGERWFCSASEAEAAGWRKPR